MESMPIHVRIYTISVGSNLKEYRVLLKKCKLCVELSVIELNLSILKWNPGHLDGIYANPCENLHHFSRIYYITDLLILQFI